MDEKQLIELEDKLRLSGWVHSKELTWIDPVTGIGYHDSETAYNVHQNRTDKVLNGFTGPFDSMHRSRFDRINRELMVDMGNLKEAIAEFDSYRHAWSEIEANNSKPGRGSDLAKRLEIMQGYALMNIDACAFRLRKRICGEIR